MSQRIALKEPPGLLEMLAYSYFPTSFLVGPQLPMKRYQEFVSGLYDEVY
jgi:lysophospholipid acyltransferase 5